MDSGFSQKIALPAATAPSTIARCVEVGVTMTTASTDGSPNTSDGSVELRSTPNSRATLSTAAPSTSATAVRRVHGIRVARSRA